MVLGLWYISCITPVKSLFKSVPKYIFHVHWLRYHKNIFDYTLSCYNYRLPMGKRHDRYVNKRAKAQTNKIISKLTYSPAKHKNQKIRALRLKQRKKAVQDQSVPRPTPKLKFGSFNVNGLDLEVQWTIQQLLQTRGFDVCHQINCSHN